VLFAARISAKLNLYLGVRKINVEFIPEHLNHLPSHFRTARMNWLFPISITGLSVAAAYWLGHVFAAETRPMRWAMPFWARSPRWPFSSTGSWCSPCRTKDCGAGCSRTVQRQPKPSRQARKPDEL
jgi:hypothetical protein